MAEERVLHDIAGHAHPELEPGLIEHLRGEPYPDPPDPAEREVCPVCGSEISGPCFCKNCGHKDCGE